MYRIHSHRNMNKNIVFEHIRQHNKKSILNLNKQTDSNSIKDVLLPLKVTLYVLLAVQCHILICICSLRRVFHSLIYAH